MKPPRFSHVFNRFGLGSALLERRGAEKLLCSFCAYPQIRRRHGRGEATGAPDNRGNGLGSNTAQKQSADGRGNARAPIGDHIRNESSRSPPKGWGE